MPLELASYLLDCVQIPVCTSISCTQYNFEGRGQQVVTASLICLQDLPLTSLLDPRDTDKLSIMHAMILNKINIFYLTAADRESNKSSYKFTHSSNLLNHIHYHLLWNCCMFCLVVEEMIPDATLYEHCKKA